jgi:UDP-glucose 4-epimerase
MVCLVTGGTGFIGPRIVRDLVKAGDTVVVFDAVPQAQALRQTLTEQEQAGVKMVQADILDLAALLRACKEHRVETIVHMAYFKVLHAKANPLMATKVNCEGTGNVFEAARILGIRRVVWASSIAVFGPPERYGGQPIENDAPHCPDTFYGACKSFNEHQAAYYCDAYGLDILGLRYAVGYGPNKVGSTSYPIIREVMEKPAVGESGRVPNGDSLLNWLHVDDAAAAAAYATTAPRTKTRVFTVAGETHSVKDVAECVREFLPTADIVLEPGKLVFACHFDLRPMREELGYRNRLSFREGIRETINEVRRAHGLPTV